MAIAIGTMTDEDAFRTLQEEWDRRFASAPQLFRAEADETLVTLASPLPAGRAVDLGAGEGRNSVWLARHGWKVTSVDASAVALDRLAALARDEGLDIRTVVDDLVLCLHATREAGDTFDLVVIAYVHPDRAGQTELLAAAASSLRPGGHLFVVGHHLSSLGIVGPPDARRLYDEDDLRTVPDVEILSLQLRHGRSDVAASGTDIVLWARRPAPVTPAS